MSGSTKWQWQPTVANSVMFMSCTCELYRISAGGVDKTTLSLSEVENKQTIPGVHCCCKKNNCKRVYIKLQSYFIPCKNMFNSIIMLYKDLWRNCEWWTVRDVILHKIPPKKLGCCLNKNRVQWLENLINPYLFTLDYRTVKMYNFKKNIS